MKKKIELNKDVAEQFELIGNPVSSKFVDPKYREIDFRKMTVKQACNLVAVGFPYLKRKELKEPKTSTKE